MDQEQEYDNDHLSEMQEKLKEFQSALQDQENMMRTLLQLRITDIRLLLRREEEKVLWPKTKEFFNNTIKDLKARIKQELKRRDQEQRKQQIQAARRCQVTTDLKELERRDQERRKQQTQEARCCQFTTDLKASDDTSDPSFNSPHHRGSKYGVNNTTFDTSKGSNTTPSVPRNLALHQPKHLEVKE